MSVNDLTAPIDFRELPWLPGYRAHRDGYAESNVYTGHWRRLNPSRRKNGFYRFDVYLGGKRKCLSLHEVICEAWHGPRPPGTECIFVDGNMDNLRESNLVWGNAPENVFDPSVEYRSLPECDGYLFGDDGSGWTCWRTSAEEKGDVWRRLKPTKIKSGHTEVCIKINGKSTAAYMHRLICAAFHGPCPDGMECCHNDGNPAHNAASNLRWGTSQDNVDDQIRHGTKARGERCGSAKLTDEKVKEILALKHLGPRKLGRMFGLAHGTIGRILRGEGWTHVA